MTELVTPNVSVVNDYPLLRSFLDKIRRRVNAISTDADGVENLQITNYNTLTDLPLAGTKGRLAYTIDTNITYLDNGTSWVQVYTYDTPTGSDGILDGGERMNPDSIYDGGNRV